MVKARTENCRDETRLVESQWSKEGYIEKFFESTTFGAVISVRHLMEDVTSMGVYVVIHEKIQCAPFYCIHYFSPQYLVVKRISVITGMVSSVRVTTRSMILQIC